MWVRLLGCVLVLIPMSVPAGEPSASGVRDHFEKKIRPSSMRGTGTWLRG